MKVKRNMKMKKYLNKKTCLKKEDSILNMINKHLPKQKQKHNMKVVKYKL